jgi:malonyl-CoA/methylmalonyl-CoA synthetase
VISRKSRLPFMAHTQRYGGRTAIVDSQGFFTYNDLLAASSRVAAALLAGRDDLEEERIAFLLTPGSPWVAV